MLECQGEQALIDAGLGWTRITGPLAAVVKNYERRRIFPVDKFPGKQRVIRFRLANIAGIFFVVVVLPFFQKLVAMPIAHLAQEYVGCLLGRSVPQRIHFDADGQTGQWIVVIRPSQYRTLVAQPPQIAHEPEHEQSTSADSNADLRPSEGH